MPRSLNGKDVADFIKERQLRTSRNLKQAHGITPKLAIVRTNPDPVVDTYMRLKTQYGMEIEVNVYVYTIDQSAALKTIEALNDDKSIHGIIVQIPLPDRSQTDEVLNSVSLAKDVDGLAVGSKFDAPTPTAINWLLSGYNVELRSKAITIVGNGRLVGAPLAKLWRASNLEVLVADKHTPDLAQVLKNSDIIVTATGQPGIITVDMVKEGAVIVDAGVSTDSNGLVGDVAPEVRLRKDITITPETGGVGPLTVTALFENVLQSARHFANQKDIL